MALKVMEILQFTALPGWSEDSIPCPPTGTGAVTNPESLKRGAGICSPWSVAPGVHGLLLSYPGMLNKKSELRIK